MNNSESTTIRILNQEYQLKGNDSEYLEHIGVVLDKRLHGLKDQHNLYSSTKIAVLLLIQLQDEYYQLQNDYDNLLKEIQLLKI